MGELCFTLWAFYYQGPQDGWKTDTKQARRVKISARQEKNKKRIYKKQSGEKGKIRDSIYKD